MKLFIVSPGSRPVMIGSTSNGVEHVIYVDDEVDDPFSIVRAAEEGRAYELGVERLRR